MNTTVQLKVKQNYGNQALYPANEQAQIFADIAGTKTLTIQVVKQILKLGYTVEYIHGEVTI